MVIHRLALFLFKLGLVLFLKKRKRREWGPMSEADSSDDFELLFLNKTKEETTSLMSFLTSLL